MIEMRIYGCSSDECFINSIKKRKKCKILSWKNKMPGVVTHCCISYIVARHFCRNNKLLLVLSGLSPDIDIIVGGIYILITGPFPSSAVEFARGSLIFHPTVTASLFFVPLFSLFMLMFFLFINRKMVPMEIKKGYGIVLAGILIHLGLDMLQTGNKPFWPMKIEAGLNLIPYSVSGGVVTTLIAVGLLVLDIRLFNSVKKRFRR
jgi:hypothetical protein